MGEPTFPHPNSKRKFDGLAKQNIQWQCNLKRAPWWDGQFERLIGIMKQSMYEAIGNGHLRWHELEGVILDVETTLNNNFLVI